MDEFLVEKSAKEVGLVDEIGGRDGIIRLY